MTNNQNEENENNFCCSCSQVYDHSSITFGNNFPLPNNNAKCSDEGNTLIDFYRNSTILITGGTGFIGKALIEKLLRTCTNISRIYVLIRPKRNQTVEERCKNLLNSSVFDRIRLEGNSEKLFPKITGVAGNIAEPNLGISPEYLQILIENVTVVFHSAATVKFNESLETATRLNILGTQEVILICQKMTNLKALVHVSTAYSNVDRENIEEVVYPIPDFQRNTQHPENILSMELLKSIGKKMEQTHPNTYTLTKAIAELLVAELATKIPVAIVRPSIVTAAWREPFEGWIENTTGITGFLLGIGQGLISSVLCDRRFLVDLIPVDIVVNTLVASAYYICGSSSDKLQVFNCTSGSFNPIIWDELGSLLRHYSQIMPSKYVQGYPALTLRTNRFMHFLHEGVCQLLPALFTDTILKLTGNKPIFLKVHKKLTKMKQTAEYFTQNQWNFSSENIRTLQEILRQSSEHEIFNVDPSMISWDVYVKNYVLGVRKYVLKDSEDSLPWAKKKLKRLYWTRRLIQIFSIVVIYNLRFLGGTFSLPQLENL